MPRKATQAKVLSGLVFCCSGTLSMKRSDIEKEIKNNGGKTSSTITNSTTHLITTSTEANGNPTSKVEKAIDKSIPIVGEDFLWKCIESGKVVDFRKFLLISDNNGSDDDDGSG